LAFEKRGVTIMERENKENKDDPNSDLVPFTHKQLFSEQKIN
jgi:hypothetical protein